MRSFSNKFVRLSIRAARQSVYLPVFFRCKFPYRFSFFSYDRTCELPFSRLYPSRYPPPSPLPPYCYLYVGPMSVCPSVYMYRSFLCLFKLKYKMMTHLLDRLFSQTVKLPAQFDEHRQTISIPNYQLDQNKVNADSHV